jgi:hypothetical protein
MSYKTTLARLIEKDFAYASSIPPNLNTLRNILKHGNRSGSGAPYETSRLLKIASQSSTYSYLEVLLDNDIQFEDTSTQGFSESFDISKVYRGLTQSEGWLENSVMTEAQKLIPTEVWYPLREVIYINENLVELVGASVAVFCLASNSIMLNGS